MEPEAVTTVDRPSPAGETWRTVGRALLGRKAPESVNTSPSGRHWGDEELIGRQDREIHWLKVWRMCLLGAVALAYGGTLFLALQPAPIFLVVADATGKILYEGKPGSFDVSDLFIETRLRQWIDLVRRRSDDPKVNALWREEALRMTTGEATGLLTAYFDKVAEVERQNHGNRWRVTTSFSGEALKLKGTITKVSRTEYRIIWTEDWTPQFGVGKKLIVMDGTFKVKLAEKAGPLGAFQLTVAQHQQAPFGVYLDWFTWNAMSEGNG